MPRPGGAARTVESFWQRSGQWRRIPNSESDSMDGDPVSRRLEKPGGPSCVQPGEQQENRPAGLLHAGSRWLLPKDITRFKTFQVSEHPMFQNLQVSEQSEIDFKIANFLPACSRLAAMDPA